MPKELTVVAATRRLGITIDALYRLIYAGELSRTEIRQALGDSGGCSRATSEST